MDLSDPAKLKPERVLQLAKINQAAYDDANVESPAKGFLPPKAKAMVQEYPTHTVVTIPGTDRKSHVAHDLYGTTTMTTDLSGNNQGRAHSGALRFKEHLMPELRTQIPKDKPVFLTGHSLGGPSAELAGRSLSEEGYDVRGVTTFNAFRAGTPNLQNTLDKAPYSTTRVVHGKDPVSDLGPKFMGFADPKNKVYIDSKTGAILPSKQTSSGLVDSMRYPIDGKRDHGIDATVESLEKTAARSRTQPGADPA